MQAADVEAQGLNNNLKPQEVLQMSEPEAEKLSKIML